MAVIDRMVTPHDQAPIYLAFATESGIIVAMPSASIEPASAIGLPSWPANRPFPLSTEECVALCRGDRVRWRGSISNALELPFRFELIDGWLMLKRPG